MDDVSIFWLIIVGIIFVVGVVFIVISENISEKKREQEQRKLEQLKRLREQWDREQRERRKQFISEKHGTFIQKFAERRFQGQASEEDMVHLMDLLIKKTPIISDYFNLRQILKELIDSHIDSLEQEEFNQSIVFSNPKNFQDCLEVFCRQYPKPSADEFSQFQEFISQNPRFAPPDQYDLEELIQEKQKEIQLQQQKKQKEIQLQQFEQKILQNSDSDSSQAYVSIEDVDGMEGHEFERFLEILFTKMGFQTKKTPGSGDQGVDLVLKKDGLITAVQAKRSQSNIPNDAVQEVVAGKSLYQAHRAMVVTNHFFGNSAKKLAKANSVQLVDREKLESWISLYQIPL